MPSASELIDAFCDQVWLQDGLAPSSLASYRRDLEQWASWLDRRDKALLTAHRTDVEAFLADQFRAKAKATSIARRLSALRRFYRLHAEDGSIRVSERLRSVPSWVLDYVLVHELAHLRVPGHDAAFWSLVTRYPRAERARGYLDGLSAGAALPFQQDLGDDVDALAGAATGARSQR